MHKRKTYAVFGLGRYGTAVAKELVDNGMEVIAVDSNQKIVDDAAMFLPVCRCGDVTDVDVITKLGIRNVDTVIVCMASNLEASVMAVTLCKDVGVPTVIAKSANEMHQKILLRVGADKVIFPEYESGIRLAKNLVSSGFVDMISLSKNVSMVEIEVKTEWVGKSLMELDFRKKYAFNIVAIRQGEDVKVNINPEQPLSGDMILIVIAKTSNLNKL